MSIQHDEQWLSNGNCEKCRRQKYCSKSCTARKSKENAMFREAVLKVSKLDKVFETLREVTKYDT